MGVRQKLGAVRKPGANFPVHLLILEHVRLWNGLGFARLDDLNENALCVAVRQIFAIRRNRTILDGILEGIGGELLHLQLCLRGLLEFNKPKDHTKNNEQCRGSADTHPISNKRTEEFMYRVNSRTTAPLLHANVAILTARELSQRGRWLHKIGCHVYAAS